MSYSSLRPWLQLIRLPNQFTVPGDVLAGLALAGGFGTVSVLHLLRVIAASLLLYSAGLLLNDWFDRHIDAEERPSRPIPAGEVSVGAVRTAGFGCILAANAIAGLIGPAVLACSIALSVCVVAYNAGAKKKPLIGVPVMAACRSLNILLGAAVVGFSGPGLPYVLIAAGVIGLYIIIVCWIAFNEVTELPSKAAIVCVALSPFAVLVPGVQALSGEGCGGVWLCWALVLVNAWHLTSRLWRNTDIKMTGPLVGQLIRHMIFIQAYWLAAGGGTCYWVVGVIGLWAIGGIAGRKFYGS
jgi:4-hydroxybenzoate polyprenyltransferase